MNILSASGISKSFNDHNALTNVDLDINKGSIFGLLGPNGAGKTTFIRILNQIIDPDSGTIHINGKPLAPNHIETIGYLPEERGLYKKMKVGEQLLYLARLKGVPKSKAVALIKDWLVKFDLIEWKNKNIEDLSKGMQQKIQFIATILHEPELIVLDEPFSGFDPINANLIKDEILKLRDQGSTIIFSTHRMESVEELCDHIALINQSRKILDGSKKDIKQQFRSNTFEITYEGHLNMASAPVIVENLPSTEEGYSSATLQINNGQKPNDILALLIGQVEIHRFVEKVPTINEIFIQKVQENQKHG